MPVSTRTVEPLVLEEDEWRARADAHRARVRRWTAPHLARRRAGETHPVLDFLFTYYGYRPAQLERWHPGPGVVLRGTRPDDPVARPPAYVHDGRHAGVRLDLAALHDRFAPTAGFVRSLLGATAARTPRLACFGLHEWAMVYRSDRPRHASVPLRLGAAGTDAVVESMSLRCTHHDAFRFFTDAAVPLNDTAPARADQVATEQPGCLHANMDLYKWATKLSPLTPSALVADCFALAVEVRELDMAASPYDLRAHGYAPVMIETPQGRAAYVKAQAAFAARSAPLRQQLLDLCDLLLRTAQPGPADRPDRSVTGEMSSPGDPFEPLPRTLDEA